MTDLTNIIDTTRLQPVPAMQIAKQNIGNMSGNTANSLHAKAREKASEFEAIFIAQMLKPMVESVPTDGLMGGGKSEEMFRSMMVDEIGKDIAKQGGIGIADSIYHEILKLQEA